MARVFSAWYLRMLETKPITTKSMSSFLVLTGGDVLAQNLEARGKSAEEKQLQKKGQWEVLGIQWDRTLRMGAMGALYVAPVLHFYFRGMDKVIMRPNGPIMSQLQRVSLRYFGSKTAHPTMIAATKLLIDQTVFAPFIIASVMTVGSVVNGKSWEQIKEMFRTQYPQALKTNYFVWPFVNFVTFRYVPESFRVLFSNSASVGWNCFLSTLIHEPSSP